MDNGRNDAENRTHRYDDIINLPHHVSEKRPRLSSESRVAQFSPFAALTGFEEKISETGRFTEEKIELSESATQAISERLGIIYEQVESNPLIKITYFVKDGKKTGGRYITAEDRVRKIDGYGEAAVMWDGTRIPFADIYSIDGEIFATLENEDIPYDWET